MFVRVLVLLALILCTLCCDPAERSAQPRAEEHEAAAEKPAVHMPQPFPPLVAADCAEQAATVADSLPEVTDADDLRKVVIDGAVELSAGPILGAITDRSVTVWVRANRPSPWRIKLWPLAQAKEARLVEGDEPTLVHDLTSALRIDALLPGTTYQYQVILGAVGKGTVSLPIKSFHTLPASGTASKLRIAVGADIAGEDKQPIFSAIEGIKPDILLLIGDQIYADKLKPSFPEFARKYEHNWNIPELNALMQSVPTFMIWDDHEIEDNYFHGASDVRYRPARLAYSLYAHAHNPAPIRPGELYYSFEAGDVSFFVLDDRSHRSDPKLEDGDGKSMLGERQKADLAHFLKCSPGKIKVLVSPVVISKHARGNDSWNSYDAERAQILDFIERERVDNLIVLSGDQHWSAVFMHDLPATRFYEFLPTPLSKEIGHATRVPATDIIARDDDNFVFGVVDLDTTVEPATVAFTLCALGRPCRPGEEPAPVSGLDEEGERENVPFTVKLTELDFGPR